MALTLFWKADHQLQKFSFSAPLRKFSPNESVSISQVHQDPLSFSVGLVSGIVPPFGDTLTFVFRSVEGGRSYGVPAEPFCLDIGTVSTLLLAPFCRFCISFS